MAKPPKPNRYALFFAMLKTMDTCWLEEYKFHPTRRFRFDFALPRLRLAIEVDGGIFTGGRHSRGLGQEADMVKGHEATLLGWSVLHFSVRQVKSGYASQIVMRVMQQRDCP